jgi:hypothetical protein
MLVTGLTVYLTWVTVNTYVDKLLSKYHLDSAESKIVFSDFLSKMSESLNILKPSQLNNQASEKKPELAQNTESTEEPTRQTLADPLVTEIPSSVNSEGTTSPEPTPTSTPTPTPTPTDTYSTSGETNPDDSVSVWNQTSNESEQEKTTTDKQKNLVMSAEQFTKKKDQISEVDKVKIFTLLATRLPQSEFQQISTYVEDGVTEQEWLDIQSIVEQYVNPEEYKELQDLLDQY